MEITPIAGTTSSRRLKRLMVSFELARSFVTAGDHAHRYVVTAEPIPDDAVLVNVRHAWPNCIELLLCSDSFEEVADGQEIPLLTPVCETVPIPREVDQ